jgi:hypothetical protein
MDNLKKNNENKPQAYTNDTSLTYHYHNSIEKKKDI